MTVADRYEGEEAGACGCGSRLIWYREADGRWKVRHADAEMRHAS
jgi:ketosteroid isomerase-like protein